jgi:2-succinyl-5-enolpyruvyl-6-hydroxy-3-cyclohexene-1-carboxylate synthase
LPCEIRQTAIVKTHPDVFQTKDDKLFSKSTNSLPLAEDADLEKQIERFDKDSKVGEFVEVWVQIKKKVKLNFSLRAPLYQNFGATIKSTEKLKKSTKTTKSTEKETTNPVPTLQTQIFDSLNMLERTTAKTTVMTILAKIQVTKILVKKVVILALTRTVIESIWIGCCSNKLLT